MLFRRGIRGLLAGAVLALLAGGAPARDISVMRDWTGRHYVLAADDAGFHKHPIPIQVTAVEITEGLAHVVGGQTHILYGMTPKGVRGRQIDLELGGAVGAIHHGDRIAVIEGVLVHYVYAVTDEGIAGFEIHSQVKTIEIEGNLAYLQTDRGHFLFGPAAGKVAVQELTVGVSPGQILMARNQALQRIGRRTYLHYLNDQGFHVTRLDESGQPPGDVYIGGYAGHSVGERSLP